MIKFNPYLKSLLILTTLLICSQSYAEYDDNLKDQVLGQVGKIKIKREKCNYKTYVCNYVLYDTNSKKQILIEDWNKTANVYQFSPKLMGFLFGATGSGHILTTIDDQNRKKEYSNFEAMNHSQTCMVTFERGLKKMPDSLVFYSIPDFRTRLVLNRNVPQFKKLNDLTSRSFEENGDFSFEFSYFENGEMSIQNVIIQKPCQSDYRIIMN